VLDDLGFSPEKVAVLKMKAEMHAALLRKAKKYTQKELQGILKEPQPRISEFLNGKIAPVSFEKMTIYAFRLGTKPSIKLESVPKHGTRLAGRTSKGKLLSRPRRSCLRRSLLGSTQSLQALLIFGFPCSGKAVMLLPPPNASPTTRM
jgi:predicted XRE-type DNA-binding protein